MNRGSGVYYTMQKHGDYEIVKAILQGDIERYSELLDKYQGAIYAIVARRIPVTEVPAVAHEVFVQAYKSLSGYSGKAQFGNWVSRIAVRTCCSYWRKKNRDRNRHVSIDADEGKTTQITATAANSASAVTNNLEQRETREILNKVLDRLSAEDRTLIESVYFDGMPLKEVAEAMNWSVVTTKVRAFRARRKMKRLLEEMGNLS